MSMSQNHGTGRAVPDGGYGWVVVLGAAFTHLLLVGMARSLGVLYLILLDMYGESASATSGVIATFNTCRTLTAPLCSVLLEKLGGRVTAIAGAVVLCSGLVLSALVSNLWLLYASLGLVSGFGGAMVFVPAYVMVSKYFDKHKGKAMAFATIGSGLGNIMFAPLINVLFDHYALSGALLILGGLQLHNAIAGSLYRPLPVTPPKSEMSVISDRSELTADKSDVTTDKSDVTTEKCDTTTDKLIGVIKGEGDIAPYTACEQPIDPITSPETQRLCGPGSLLRNWTFHLYGLLVVTMQTCIMTFLIFLPDFCREVGVERHTAAWTLTIFGAFDMAGRFLFGFVFDLRRIRENRRNFYCFVTFMFGCGVAGMSTMFTFPGICVITAITAVFEGASHSQRATIVSEIVQRSQLPRAVGIVIFCQGLGNMTGPPLAGLLKDLTGTCRYGFVLCGCALMAGSLLFLAESFLCRTCRNKQRELTHTQ